MSLVFETGESFRLPRGAGDWLKCLPILRRWIGPRADPDLLRWEDDGGPAARE